MHAPERVLEPYWRQFRRSGHLGVHATLLRVRPEYAHHAAEAPGPKDHGSRLVGTASRHRQCRRAPIIDPEPLPRVITRRKARLSVVATRASIVESEMG